MNLTITETIDTAKFRLIGKSVLTYRFIIPHDATLFVGDILKIVDSKKGYTFYAKVTDLLHESNFNDPNWDTRVYSENFFELGDDVFLGVEAVPLGFVDETGEFRKPGTVPTKFSRVERPVKEDFFFLSRVMGDIEVGTMKTGQGTYTDVKVAIPSEVLSSHMGIFATTGSGKSNFMKVFLSSCIPVRKFGILLVDPHGDYVTGNPKDAGSKGLVQLRSNTEGIAFFTTGDEERRKRYSMQRLYISYEDFSIYDLTLHYELSSTQFDIIETLSEFHPTDVIKFFQNTSFKGWKPESYEGGYTQIADRLRNYQESTLNVMQRRIQTIVSSQKGFFDETRSSVKEIIEALHENKVVLIDMPFMSEKSELFALSILSRKILRDHQERVSGKGRKAGEYQVMIAIEEAQRVLSPGSSTKIFRECAMEGRKFGVGLCVITQQPKNIDPKILAQINTYVVMGLSDKADRDIVETSAKQDLSKMDVEIQTLERGDAIISTLQIPFPISTRVHYFEDYIDHVKETLKSEKNEERIETF